MYRLKKNKKGTVTSLLRTGKDFVKNDLPATAAQQIIDNGTVVKSDKHGFPICVDNKWYFEGEKVRNTAVQTEEHSDKKRGKRHG
jgi:hypothetical protein